MYIKVKCPVGICPLALALTLAMSIVQGVKELSKIYSSLKLKYLLYFCYLLFFNIITSFQRGKRILIDEM